MACTGAPVILAIPSWSRSILDLIYKCGSHMSAANQFANFLLEDMYNYIQMGYWIVLPYSSVRDLPNLCLAPSSVVPQQDCHPHYSFDGTNQACLSIAPQATMQFGTALQQILQCLAHCNEQYGPPLMAKVDLADGFYRIPLSPEASLALAVIIPSDIPSQPSLISPPLMLLMLLMGWTHSPPYFCAYMETITNIANTSNTSVLHQALATTQCASLPQETSFHPSAITLGPKNAPKLCYTDVYMDDFMVLAQAPDHLPSINRLLHAIDSILTEPTDTNRRPIASASKIAKGNATFSTTKRILGWDLNTSTMMIMLPKHRLISLKSQLQSTIE